MNTKDFALTAIFLSIILLFSFTPIGFIHLGIIKATMIHIPVIIASIVLGPKTGAFLGLAFGMTSIITNTISPTLLSFAFSPVIPVLGTGEGSLWALFFAIVPRVTLGFVPYFLFKGIQRMLRRKNSQQKRSLFLTGLFSTFIHTFFVLGSIAILFQDAYAKAIHAETASAIFKAVLTVFFTNGLSEAILAAFATAMVVPPLLKKFKKRK